MVPSIGYQVLKRIDDMEIRKYPPVILASVSGMEDNAAFSILFDFTQGNNRSRRKISMTTPVISSERISMTAPVISDNASFSFVMPEKMTADEVPDPNDKRVIIERIPGRVLAVKRFRGRSTEKRVEKFADQLRKVLDENGMDFTGDPLLMRYDPPFKPPPFRKNEVALELKNSGSY